MELLAVAGILLAIFAGAALITQKGDE